MVYGHIIKLIYIWAYNNTTWGSLMRPYTPIQKIKFKNNYSQTHVDFKYATDEFLFNKFFQLMRKYGKVTQKYLIREIQRRRLWEKYPELKPYFCNSTCNVTIYGDSYTLEKIPSCIGNYTKCSRCSCPFSLACMEASQI